MRHYLLLAAAALPLAFAAPAVAAPIIQYNFTGQPGTEASVTATGAATGVTGLAFMRGTGLATSGAANSISSTGWSTSADDYYSFGFNVAAGRTATVSDLMFGSQASGTGPGLINVLASVDGGAFTTVGSYSLAAATNLSQTLTFTSALTALSKIEFRLVAANSTNANGTGTIASTGTFRVTNFDPTGDNTPFAIDGTVAAASSPVPEPASWAMMIVGAGLVGGAMRRRSRSTRVTFAA